MNNPYIQRPIGTLSPELWNAPAGRTFQFQGMGSRRGKADFTLSGHLLTAFIDHPGIAMLIAARTKPMTAAIEALKSKTDCDTELGKP